ncbi:MAG: LuxR C-terminal-related transcriptional regulator [Pseudomonadota bacterium]
MTQVDALSIRQARYARTLNMQPSEVPGKKGHNTPAPLTKLRSLLSQPRSASNPFDSIKALGSYLEAEYELQVAFVSCRLLKTPTSDAVFVYDSEGMTRALERARHYRTCPPIDLAVAEANRPQTWAEATNLAPSHLEELNASSSHSKRLMLLPFTQADHTILLGLRPTAQPTKKDAACVESVHALCLQYLAAHFAEHPPTQRNRQRVLSPQEEKVMQYCAMGLTDKETAIELKISPHTVRAHLNNAKEKLKARNKTHAAILYWMNTGQRETGKIG